jgi:enoyl-CoA hydratase/carnithine racemase
MTELDPVLVETRNRKMYITMNRPQVLNAQNDALRRGLIAALDRFEDDDELGVALLLGHGRAFSAGADLNEVRPAAAVPGNNHFDRLDQLRKPIIAGIHGYAVGGGLEIALCCDVRVATEDALLGLPEARTINGLPGIAAPRLSRLIPLGEALSLMLSSQPISGRRAYDIGLVQRIAAGREAMIEAADQLADQMLECNPSSLMTIKQIARTPVELEMASTQRLTALGRITPLQQPPLAPDRAAYLEARRAARSETGNHR